MGQRSVGAVFGGTGRLRHAVGGRLSCRPAAPDFDTLPVRRSYLSTCPLKWQTVSSKGLVEQ